MRVWAEINLDNLKNNLDEIKKRIENRHILGVVKANAYGHGANRYRDWEKSKPCFIYRNFHSIISFGF